MTNIYEGTSQLQIVAALGKILGHALDDLMDKWAALDYGPELDPLKVQVADATELFKQSIDRLKENEREIIDYYASDLVNMGVYLVNCWLLLQDARLSDRKKAIARLYMAEYLPQVYSAGEAIRAANSSPLEVRDTVLASPF